MKNMIRLSGFSRKFCRIPTVAPFVTAAFLGAALSALHADGFVQVVPCDLADSRQNYPLRVARGEVVDISIDFSYRNEPLDISGSPFVVLDCQTNGQDNAESFRVTGVATNGNSALFRVVVDDFCPESSGMWSCTVSNEWATLARTGGPVYVRQTAAATAHALPKSALDGYATTNYVAGAIAAIPPPPPETDPVFAANSNRFLVAESDPTVPAWAKALAPPAEDDPVFSEWLGTGFEMDVDAYANGAATEALRTATNYTDAAIAAIDIPDPDYSQSNAVLVATIEAVAPAPGDYAAVSNAAMSAVQPGDFPAIESDPVWDGEKANYATKTEVQTVEASVNLVAMMVQGSNVVAEVTNYNSRVHAPALRLLQLNESNEYFQVWAETNGLARVALAATNHADAVSADALAASTNYAAPRAWSRTTSGLGADAPVGYTWMSTPRTVLAGGLEFEKHATANGAIWILASNGMAADFHAQTNNTAFLDLSSADGTPVFRVEKTDSFLVGVDTTSVSVDGDTLVCGVNAVAAEHPLVRIKASLSDPEWAKEEDGIPASLATVAWSGSAGAWVCEITKTHSGPAIFATMEYLQEGGTKIINSAPLDVSQGILCTDGIHRVRPVWSNGAVTWEVMQ